MRYEVQSIRIWSFLKIVFFLNIFVGFMCGVIFALFTASTLAIMQEVPMALPYGMEMPTDFPIGMFFIIYPIMGSIFSAVFLTTFEIVIIAIYNLIAKLTGGFELDLKSVAEFVPVQQPITAQARYQSPPPPPSPAVNTTPAPPSPPVSPTPPPPSTDYSAPLTPPQPTIKPKTDDVNEPPRTDPDEPKPE